MIFPLRPCVLRVCGLILRCGVAEGMILRFEDCELDTGRYEMRRGGQPLHVEPQVFDLLCLLIEHRDRIVSKDELFEKIWAGRIVSDEPSGTER